MNCGGWRVESGLLATYQIMGDCGKVRVQSVACSIEL